MRMRGKAAAWVLGGVLAAGLWAGAMPAPAQAAGTSSATTPVYIDAERAVLRVAVPIDLRLVASAAGGDLACPSDDVYGLWNYSTNTAVYVSKVEAVYNGQVNASGARWRLVDDAALVGAGRETDGAELANLMVTLVAPDAQGGADAFALDAGQPKVPAADRAWRIDRAPMAGSGSSADQAAAGVMFPINFQEGGCANSIVRNAYLANQMSQGDAALGIDPASAFKLKFTMTTARP